MQPRQLLAERIIQMRRLQFRIYKFIEVERIPTTTV